MYQYGYNDDEYIQLLTKIRLNYMTKNTIFQEINYKTQKYQRKAVFLIVSKINLNFNCISVYQKILSKKEKPIQLLFPIINSTSMRNHFSQTLPFPKNNRDPLHHSRSKQRENNHSPLPQTTKKISFYHETITPKPENNHQHETKTSIEVDHLNETANKSLTTLETESKVFKYNPFSGKQKLHGPNGYDPLSPKNNQFAINPSALTKSSTNAAASPPVRTTLKTLISSKGFFPPEHKDQSAIETCNLNGSKTNSVHINGKGNKTPNESSLRRSVKIIQKQNQILKQQNQMLRFELSEIKKHLLSGQPSKKQEIISNLRDTIKKQDSQIKQLRYKLEISTKKVATLNSLLQTKDEQIQFLNNKTEQLILEIRDLKDKNSLKLQHLKQKTNFIMNQFNLLEQKFTLQEQEWFSLKNNWTEEKHLYMHRINFLENYISSSQ